MALRERISGPENFLEKFFKKVVDIPGTGCYSMQVASREAQQKNLENQITDSTHNPEIP